MVVSLQNKFALLFKAWAGETRSETLRHLGRRGVRLCVVRDDADWDLAPFGTTQSESLRRLRCHIVGFCVVFHVIEWDFSSSEMTQNEALHRLGRRGVPQSDALVGVEWPNSPLFNFAAQHIAYVLPVFLYRLFECKLSLFTFNNFKNNCWRGLNSKLFFFPGR